MNHIVCVVKLIVVLFCINQVKSVCPTEKHFTDSKAYFEHAESIVLEDPKEALPFYRAAVRLCPSEGQYWFRLGTIERKLNLSEKWPKRFHKAYSLGVDIDDSVKEFFDVISIGETRNLFLDSTISSKVEFNYSLDCQLLEPFILRNQFDPSIFNNLSDFTKLNKIYGHEIVEFYPQNMRISPERMYKVSLKEALEFLSYPEGAYKSSDISESGTYIQWNVNPTEFKTIFENINIPPIVNYLSDHLFSFFETSYDAYKHSNSVHVSSFAKNTHWFMLLIGENGSGMFNHTDKLPLGSWQMQILGEKRWKICPSLDESIVSIKSNSRCALKPYSCYDEIIKPGDIIYYPPLYWHETLSLSEVTLSISASVIHPYYKVLLESFIFEDCNHSNSFNFHLDICEKLRRKFAEISS